ncbi:DUF3320 domain-containing protein [Sanguibacter massiliensis]|uniref:DUF3320 domain-containing protein n=1 Tax=Sanguibacter massiliensis TaxID=1973217 RepID=UPI000C862403|nr:Swt1 family HEPN domain-containing protein [Sanguibacter massiliensis]
MTYDARIAVSAGLDHLADRLGPIIAERLPVDLAGLPWTAVLNQLDQIAGRPPRVYSATDLQAQLKMLTRRLGALGYPFDDSKQTVSTLGRELTIVRNARAHGDDFSALDAWRALDYCVRLLEHFGDGGADRARELRHATFEVYVAEQGVGAAAPAPLPPAEVEPAPTTARSVDVVTPPAGAFDRDTTPDATVVGEARMPFEPWAVVAAGEVDVLDNLRKVPAKNKVRAVASEIVDAEWPIHLDRLTALVAASFGLRRMHPPRAKKISHQARQAGVCVDEHNFVWPDAETAETWTEFRPNASNVPRPFEHVSPVEIANALAFHREHLPDADEDTIARATLQTFGRSRRTKSVDAHLALATAVASQIAPVTAS